MDVIDISRKYKELNANLKQALSTMEYSDKIMILREQIQDLQHLCPHKMNEHDFSTANECPYCGKKFKE